MRSQLPAQMCACHRVSLPYSSTDRTDRPPPCPTHPESLIPIDSHPESSLTAESHACCRTFRELTNPCRCQVTSINVLLDEILLEIFDYCVDEDGFAEKNEIEAWQSLVHVCRRWRSVVFGSPRRLNLRLVCEAKTPARDTLDVWPPLPIIIRDSSDLAEIDRVDDIIAVLKHSGRVCQIDLSGLSLSSTKKLLAAMQQPFPELTYLRLEGAPTAVPDSFLGGSAPHLRNLWLGPVKFPGVPKLLLSATHLVDLQLGDICHPRSFSLETMATALSILTSLQFLHLNAEFRFARYRPNWASPRPPPTRSLLPVLNMLRYYGVSQYFDDLVAFIDAPRLNKLDITISSYNELNIPRFTQFISSKSMLEALKKTYVVFQDDGAGVKFSSQVSGHGELQVKVPSRTFEEQLWSLEQVYTSCLPPLSTLEDLYIYEVTYQQPDWPDDLGNMPWLELLHRFPTEESLPIPGNCVTYRACPARISWEHYDRSVACLTEYILWGAPATGACPGRH